jgi:BirA family biotin operon repressor/biotin-[acetyl-CoA-carboxylase] ligase
MAGMTLAGSKLNHEVAARIAARLRHLLAQDVAVEVVARTGSTNSDLLARARGAAPALPWVRIALEQSAGRGRVGRQWQAAPGSAILMSAARRHSGTAVISAVTLACGVAVAEALRSEGIAAELKWPNDVLLGGRKLAGLLTELALDERGARTLVIGLGLNLRRTPDLPEGGAALDEVIAIDDVAAVHMQWSTRLAAAVLEAAAVVERDGFAPFEQRFNALFAWRGRAIELLDANGKVAGGTALGVDAQGRLRVESGGAVGTHTSGELSLRIAANTEIA